MPKTHAGLVVRPMLLSYLGWFLTRPWGTDNPTRTIVQ
jgi:hypothetical protein